MTIPEDKAKPIDLMASFDARDWARVFVEYARQNPALACDEGAMLGWFASALMRGWDERARRGPDALTPLLAAASVGHADQMHPIEAVVSPPPCRVGYFVPEATCSHHYPQFLAYDKHCMLCAGCGRPAPINWAAIDAAAKTWR